MVKENGMVMMTEEEFKTICKCYEKNLGDLKDEHEYETDLICNDYEKKLSHLEKKLKDLKEEYETRLGFMHKAIIALTQKTTTVPHDMRVSKADFIAIYNKAIDDFFDKMETPGGEELHNDIDGYDITVHWHGIYCNCGNGATPSNFLIPGIEDVISEDPYEDWKE